MRQKRQMDKLRFLTESRNGKESVIEKLIHKDNSSPNRISCSIAEKSDIKSVMDICFARQQWMTEQGFNYVLNKDNRKYYRHKIEDRKLWVCKQSGVVMGFCVVEDHDINGYWKDFPTDSFVYAHDGMTRPHKSVKETSDYNFIGILINAIIDFYGKGIRFDVLLPNQRLESFYEKELGCNPVKKVIDEDDGSCHLLMEKTNNNPSLTESFTKKISSKKNTDLISEPSFVLDNGVYILHETLGVRTVDGWNPKNNDGVVGVLVVEDDHKIVVATEDAPEDLPWSKKRGLINQPIEKLKDAESDFNGEVYCQKLNSPDFPAAYYCKTYNKGNRDWYLPSSGELRLIYSHFDEIQNALSIVGGQKFDTNWDEGDPVYWSSTELTATYAWNLYLVRGDLINWYTKVSHSGKVRPISKFKPSILKESFTRKIRSKKNDELTTKADTVFVPDGVYILHKTLGLKGVEGWNPKNNDGVVGVLVVEDDHKIVVATEDSPEDLPWSNEYELINQPVDDLEDAVSDFNGEIYCKRLDSPDFPDAYYCKTYNKGNRDWYLPSSGELWLICRHLEEIQNALSIVGGQKFVTSWDEGDPVYWSSTEGSDEDAWALCLSNGHLNGWYGKVNNNLKVRPVSKFDFSTLKESFTRKIRSKKNDELISKPAFEIPDGVYILHETLGVCGVDNWDSENNDGVEGILVKDNDTKLIVSVDEFTEIWARKLQSKFNVNKTFIYRDSLNTSDKKKYTGKILCQKLNSPDFPAAYRCLCYHKGNINNWYLPSIQELHTIAEHRHEIQEALIKVNGDILKFSGENFIILKSRSGQGGNWYWSSTESHREEAWSYNFDTNINSGWTKKSENSFQVRPVAYFGEESGLKESFTRKIRSKKNDELTTKADTAFVPDGVYILHETLGVRTVDSWNPEDNEGVVGILLIEDNHRIVVALEDSPKDLLWSKERKLVNKPVEGSFIDSEDAESDFNGEYYCQNLNSPDFPAAYYCLNYKKGGRNWYLPSSGELLMIYNHFEEIQNALSIVGGQKFITKNDDFGLPAYWSSTEGNSTHAWFLSLEMRCLDGWFKDYFLKVRPVSKFSSLKTLKESFTRKISQKKNDELISKPSFVLVNGVYILHETLGVKTVDGWNPKDNDGVVGILLIEDEHQIVIALEVSPKNLIWSEEYNFVNRPIKNSKTAKSKFNGEKYCRNLNSPDFPAAYYCLNYNKGGRDWYLPSMGELWLIRNHLEEIQTASSTVGRQRSVFTWDEFAPCFWSSTERDVWSAWVLNFGFRGIPYVWYDKVGKSFNVLPISKFQPSELKESFTKKISSKKNTDLISKPSFVPDDGVYILHETLGVRGVEGWNPKDNDGVVGILVVEDEHQLVVALEDSPKNLIWSKERKLVNRPIEDDKDAESDFNGEEYCRNLNSPDFPAAYYCLNYKKGGLDWYLPSAGELWLIYQHIEEVQNALSIVGGQRFDTGWDKCNKTPCYWSSTEHSAIFYAWGLYLHFGGIDWDYKASDSLKVRPFSKFQPSELKESFTKKISSKKNSDLISKPSFVTDGVYILHETLGVKSVEGWNKKFNNGVIGILLIEDEHRIVVALEDSPNDLSWSKEEDDLVNQPIKDRGDAKSDFNGEKYCRNLNSPDFPAAYYCLNYKKGDKNWYLPSSGELWIIYKHLEEVQSALSIVGGKKFVTTWDGDVPWYWSSTEGISYNVSFAWGLGIFDGYLGKWESKSIDSGKVRPISKFQPSELKESFTKKISSKKNTDLISKPSFVPDDGVYIFHKTLGLKTIDEWDRKDNLGVVGILVVQDEHQIVISLTDFLQTFHWSKEKGLVNKPIYDKSNAWSDFNGEEYCKKLNSKDFPAAYFCINYGNYRGVWSFASLSAEEMAIKADYNWYLPSAGEMGIIYKNLNDVQLALRMVGGYSIREEFYLSSSEVDASNIWKFNMYLGELSPRCVKTIDFGWVRPVFKFNSNFLKESFTKKIKKTSNKDLVDTADKLAITNYDYNEENFKNKLRKETELYYKSEFYKVYNYPLDYRYNGDIWPADEDGFHDMWMESTYYTERNEEVDFEGYFNAPDCAEPADVGIFVFGYGKDCVAYGEYEEYKKARHLTESFVSKTKKRTIKDLQGKSDDVFNLNNLLREYVKSHCRPGSHNYDFYFSEENRPVFSDKEWKKLKGITVVKEIDDYYPSLHVVTPNGFTISNDFLPNTDDVFLFYVYKRRKFHIPVNRLPDKLSQELKEWVLNVNESFTRKTKQKSAEDIKQKADEHIGFKNLVKEIVLENDSFKENDKMSRIFRKKTRCTHALNKLRVRPTSDPTLSPYEINGTVVLDKSFYFKPEKYNISSLLAKDLTRKAMKDLYNSDSIIVLNRIYTMEYRGKEFLRTEFNILRYNERYGRYSDEMNPQDVYFEFADLPKELQSDIYSFLRKRFNKK